MENTLWLFAVGVGPFLLAAAIIYALVRRRRLTPVEKDLQKREIERQYDKRQT